MKHEHMVGFYERDEGGVHIRRATDIRTYYYSGDSEERFKFCPECGASLSDFWREITLARAEHRRKSDAERVQRDAYRDTRPT